MRTRKLGSLGVGVLASIILSGGGPSVLGDIGTSTNNPASTRKAVAPYYSPAMSEVLSLLGAKVSPDVVKTFIKTAPASFDVTPQTIIGLKNLGVSDDIITALMQRDAEVRTQVADIVERSYNYTTPPQPIAEAPPENMENYAGYGGYPWGWWPYGYAGFDQFGRARFDRTGRFGFANRNIFLTSHQPTGVGGGPAPGNIAGTPPGVGGKMPLGAIPAPTRGVGKAGRSSGGGGGWGSGGGGWGGGHR
jgi:hypothetical protein